MLPFFGKYMDLVGNAIQEKIQRANQNVRALHISLQGELTNGENPRAQTKTMDADGS